MVLGVWVFSGGLVVAVGSGVFGVLVVLGWLYFWAGFFVMCSRYRRSQDCQPARARHRKPQRVNSGKA